jgi:hypothetical protein
MLPSPGVSTVVQQERPVAGRARLAVCASGRAGPLPSALVMTQAPRYSHRDRERLPGRAAPPSRQPSPARRSSVRSASSLVLPAKSATAARLLRSSMPMNPAAYACRMTSRAASRSASDALRARLADRGMAILGGLWPLTVRGCQEAGRSPRTGRDGRRQAPGLLAVRGLLLLNTHGGWRDNRRAAGLPVSPGLMHRRRLQQALLVQAAQHQQPPHRRAGDEDDGLTAGRQHYPR